MEPVLKVSDVDTEVMLFLLLRLLLAGNQRDAEQKEDEDDGEEKGKFWCHFLFCFVCCSFSRFSSLCLISLPENKMMIGYT